MIRRLTTTARSLGPRVVAGLCIDAVASGFGGTVGPLLEAAAGLAVDPLLSPSAALTGPTINGIRVHPTMTTTRTAQNATVTASKLTPELCARLDPGLLDGMALARTEPRRALELVDKFHVVDVSAANYDTWTFSSGGNPTRADTPPDMRVSGIPIPVMRDHARETYMRVKVTGQPHYLHIERQYGNSGVFSYRCLIDPVFDSAGMVCSLNVLVLVEKAAKEFVPVTVRQIEVSR